VYNRNQNVCNQIGRASELKKKSVEWCEFQRKRARALLLLSTTCSRVVSIWLRCKLCLARHAITKTTNPICIYVPQQPQDLLRQVRRHASRRATQIVLGVPFMLSCSTSSMWLHMATNKSKNNLPPISISICMVPLRLKVFRLRIIRAR